MREDARCTKSVSYFLSLRGIGNIIESLARSCTCTLGCSSMAGTAYASGFCIHRSLLQLRYIPELDWDTKDNVPSLISMEHPDTLF